MPVHTSFFNDMNPAGPNPILRIVEEQGVLILDGGLATALEARGCDLVDELWSARILLEAPEFIRAVHMDYLQAGADCITTASYQATLPGFRKRGLSGKAGRDVLGLSLRLALEARELFWREESNRRGRVEPLVAASVGPYGAFLADGSEYTGRYGIPDPKLLQFHRERWDVLANKGADLMACETIPAQREAEVLLGLLADTPDQWAWFSFSCRDEKHLSDGGLLREAARACSSEARVAAVGINCTAPEHIGSLVDEARRGTDKPIIVYPNSGEEYDPVSKRWHSPPTLTPWEEAPEVWIQKGACGVGGCCRVGPEGIARIRRALLG